MNFFKEIKDKDKKELRKKLLLLIIPTLIISIAVMLNITIAIKSRNYDEYIIEFDKDSKITSVIINNTKMPLERYMGENTKIETEEIGGEEISYLTSGDTSQVKIMVSCIDDIHIDYEGDIKIYLNGEEVEKQTEYDRSIGIVEVIKESISWYSMLTFCLAFAVVYVIILYLSYFINKLKEGEEKLWQIILTLVSLFVLYLFSFTFLMYICKSLTITVIILLSALAIYYVKGSEFKIEKAYLVIGAFMGLCIMFIIPPFNVPDEGAHFAKSFDFTVNYIKGKDSSTFPESIVNFRYKYEHASYEYDTKYNFKCYFSDLFENGDYSKQNDNVSIYGNTRNLSAMAYIPSIIVFAIMRILNVSPFILFMSGRFINLMIMIILCYYSLKNLPKYQRVIFVVALLPMFLHQGMGINQDWLTNTMAVCIVSYVIKLKYLYEKVEWKNMLILAVMALIIAYCKFRIFYGTSFWVYNTK